LLRVHYSNREIQSDYRLNDRERIQRLQLNAVSSEQFILSLSAADYKKMLRETMGDSVMSDTAEIRRLLTQYLAAMDRLRPHGIESMADFAEHLFAITLGGERLTRGSKGHDVLVPDLGRVQVKERRLPADGRIEERLHLKSLSCDSCDYLAAVIFANDFTVKKATLVPHAEVWQLIRSHRDPERKVRFDLIAALPSAVDMTERLRAALL
jgi:hypothetical protein